MDDDSSACGAFWRDVQREVWSVCCVGGRRTERSDAKSRSRGGLIIFLCGMCALLRLWTNHWEWIFKWDNYKLIISLLQCCVPQFSPSLLFFFRCFRPTDEILLCSYLSSFSRTFMRDFSAWKLCEQLVTPRQLSLATFHFTLWPHDYDDDDEIYFIFKKVVCSFLLLFRRIQHHFSTSTTLAASFYLSADDFSPSSTNFHIIHLFWNVSDERRECGAAYCKSSKNQELALSLWNVHRRKKMWRKSSTHYRRKKNIIKISYFLSRFTFVMVRMFREELRGEWDGGKKGFFIARHRWKGNPFFFDECLKREANLRAATWCKHNFHYCPELWMNGSTHKDSINCAIMLRKNQVEKLLPFQHR